MEKLANSKNVVVKFTNGFGNNLFQYCYSRLLAEKHNYKLLILWSSDNLYSKDNFKKLGINIDSYNMPLSNLNSYDMVTDAKALRKLQSQKLINNDIFVNGYFEDFRIFVPYINRIKGWFTKVEMPNANDLVFHLRLGDRLFYKQTYSDDFKVSPCQFLKAIDRFSFDKFHIVSDMKLWREITIDDLAHMEFHYGGQGGSKISKDIRIDNLQVAVDYFNSIFNALNKFAPVIRINNMIYDDFNYMRSFDKILFQHGTLAWWAAALSDATKIGVYRPWRLFKGESNKNLGNTDLPGWFGWE